MPDPFPALVKKGTGVLAIDLLNGGQHGQVQPWSQSPLVWDGVFRLGTPGTPHKAPSCFAVRMQAWASAGIRTLISGGFGVAASPRPSRLIG